MKQSIESQIAELTQEQKSNMKKIYKKYLACLFSFIAVVVVVALCFTFYIYSEQKEAKLRLELLESNRESAEAMDELLGRDTIQEGSTIDAVSDRYYDLESMKFVPIIAGAIVIFVGTLVIAGIFKKKYPYFSEKKYNYLKKHNEL